VSETELGLYLSKNGIKGAVSGDGKKQIYDLSFEKKYWLVVIASDDL
jgi:hypothetical protein